MREFYLVNEVGTTYFFNHKNKTLISSINDLGFSKDNTYLSFEDDFVLIESKNPQGNLGFKVIFQKGYAGYTEFITFIRKSTELRLFYKCEDSLKFCYVNMKSISKTELQSNTIQSSVTFDKLSLWLVRENYSIKVNEDRGGKVFPFPYPHVYSTSYNGTITVHNDSESKAPLNVYINGAVNNPTVEIMKNGDVLSSLRLLVNSSNCIIEVSSVPSDQFMTMTEGGITTNIYANQDFTCDNFLFLEKGEYQVRFTPGVTGDTVCRITLTKGYAGH